LSDRRFLAGLAVGGVWGWTERRLGWVARGEEVTPSAGCGFPVTFPGCPQAVSVARLAGTSLGVALSGADRQIQAALTPQFPGSAAVLAGRDAGPRADGPGPAITLHIRDRPWSG
jgi:hypothetical protein